MVFIDPVYQFAGNLSLEPPFCPFIVMVRILYPLKKSEDLIWEEANLTLYIC